jgi:hypothetical protein
MSISQLTRNGISKLTQLSGRPYDTNVVLQVLSVSETDFLYRPRRSADWRRREVVVSDGVHYAGGSIIVPPENEGVVRSLNHWAVIRVREVMVCWPWPGTSL